MIMCVILESFHTSQKIKNKKCNLLMSKHTILVGKRNQILTYFFSPYDDCGTLKVNVRES